MIGWNEIQDTVTIFLGIITEAIPFILLGVLVSSFISHFIQRDRLLKFIPKNRFGAILCAMGLGFLFPVCECGNVPVARKLLQKGVAPYAVIAFLLSAPVLNPLVLIATWSAFHFMPQIFYLRIVFTFLIAFFIGLMISFHPDPEVLLAKNLKKNHDHDLHPNSPTKNRFLAFLKTASIDFFEMLKVLVIGASLSAVIQLIIPRAVLLNLGNGPVLSIVAMILFAVITAVCSNVDAFIALSFVNTFTAGALLAFLTFGPLIDLKSIFMIKTALSWRAILLIFGTALLLTLLFTLSYNLYAG